MRQQVIVMTTLLVLGLCPHNANAQRKKSIFEKAADLIGNAIKPAVAPAPAVRVAPVRPPNPANARIKGQRKDRFDAHAKAMLRWMESVCDLSDKQKADISKLLDEGISRSQKTWEKQPNRGGQNGDRDFIPFEFITVARKLTHGLQLTRSLRDVLNEQQLAKFKAAIEERDNTIQQQLVGLAMLVLDRELYLTPDRRKPVAEQLKTMFGSKLYPGLYAFNYNSWPFQRAQFTRRSKLKEALGDVRYKRYERLTKNNGQAEQYVMITMGSGEGQSSFNKAVEAQPERIKEAMAIRIAWLKETENLSDKDVRRLTIAAKGAASREVDTWVEASEKQMANMREQFANQNVSWGMSQLQITAVERNSLWTKTKARVLGKAKSPGSSRDKKKQKQEAEAQVKAMVRSAIADLLHTAKAKAKPEETVVRTERQKYQRVRMVDYVVAMLDQEVWLRPSQREPLQKLIEETMSEYEKYSQYSSQYTELQLLADAVHATPEKAVEELLDEQQFAAWTQVKKQFQVQKNSNMFKMTYRHGDVQFPFVAWRNRRKSR